MSSSGEKLFSVRMRKETRQIHNLNDALVNAKFYLGLNDADTVADGLVVFYEVFKYLEGAMDRLKNTRIADFTMEELKRTKLIEDDLNSYYGSQWLENYEPRPVVVEYINHLKEIESKDPELLIVYIYHLYLGLVSGGRIIHARVNPTSVKGGRNMFNSLKVEDEVVTRVRQTFRDRLNKMAEEVTEEMLVKMIKESMVLFKMNTSLIKSVKPGKNLWKKFFATIVSILILIIAIVLILFYTFTLSGLGRA